MRIVAEREGEREEKKKARADQTSQMNQNDFICETKGLRGEMNINAGLCFAHNDTGRLRPCGPLC